MSAVKDEMSDFHLKMGERVSVMRINSSVSEQQLHTVINGLLGVECKFQPYSGESAS